MTDVVRAQDGQHELDRLGLEDAVAVLGVGEVEHDRLVERGDGVRDDAARDLRYRHRHAVLFGVEDAVEVDVDVGHLQILTLEELVDQLLLALVFDVVVGDVCRPVGVVGIDRNGQIEHIGQNLFQNRDDRTAHSVQSAGEVGLALGDLRAEDIVVRVARNALDVVADVDRNGGKHARIVLTRDALDAVDDDLLDLDEVGEVDRVLLTDLDELIDLESGLHCLVEHRGKLLVSDLEHLFFEILVCLFVESVKVKLQPFEQCVERIAAGVRIFGVDVVADAALFALSFGRHHRVDDVRDRDVAVHGQIHPLFERSVKAVEIRLGVVRIGDDLVGIDLVHLGRERERLGQAEVDIGICISVPRPQRAAAADARDDDQEQHHAYKQSDAGAVISVHPALRVHLFAVADLTLLGRQVVAYGVLEAALAGDDALGLIVQQQVVFGTRLGDALGIELGVDVVQIGFLAHR